MNPRIKKQRGTRRRLKALLKNIDRFRPFVRTNDGIEHFHVPCGNFIDSPRTRGHIKKEFVEKWIDAAMRFIDQKPGQLRFCRVVAMIATPCLWDSQIIVFYDKDYYDTFWKRTGPYQIWLPAGSGRSLVKELRIERNIREAHYRQLIVNEDNRGQYLESDLWFYGEL